jgi:CheY-like chemotaxis protein
MLFIGDPKLPDLHRGRPARRRPRRLLIVEDDPPSRIATDFLCLRLGFETASAGTVAEAVPLLRWPPDVILLDLMLPDGNGLEVLRLVREWRMETRVVVATGAYDWQLLEQVKALRPHFVLLKPLNWDVVCRWLRHA